jgi:hypothetical protein
MLHEPPIHMGYVQRINGAEPKLHSELVAYRRAKGIMTIHDFHIINLRLNRQGKTRLSKPCVCCYEILKTAGCKSFFYSTEDGFGKVT